MAQERVQIELPLPQPPLPQVPENPQDWSEFPEDIPERGVQVIDMGSETSVTDDFVILNMGE